MPVPSRSVDRFSLVGFVPCQYLKRAVLKELGMHVVQAPAHRIYFQENAARPQLAPTAHDHMRQGTWREAVRIADPFERSAEDEELEEDRRREYVATAAFEHAMGGRDEVPAPYDEHALDCPDVVTREEWDALWPYEDCVQPAAITAAGEALPEIPEGDPRLTWVVPESKQGMKRADMQAMLRSQGAQAVAEEAVSVEELDPTQRAFADMGLQWQEDLVASRARHAPADQEPQFLAILLGTAGTGKTTTLKAFLSELRRRAEDEELEEDRCRFKVHVGAYTGVAASNVGLGARTLHDLFQLAKVNEASGRLKDLEESDMKAFAEDMEGLELLVIDEMSMVSRVVLAQIQQRLREWRLHVGGPRNEALAELPFAGVSVILAGDMGQLPPVAVSPSLSLLNNSTIHGGREEDTANHGLRLFFEFNTVVRLRRIHRQPGASQYKESLIRLRDGAQTEQDHALWSTHDLGVVNEACELTAEERATFEDEAVHLFTENAPAGARNGYKAGERAQRLGDTLLRVVSRDNNGRASKEKHDSYNQLRRVVHLVRDAPVMLIYNLRTELGLVNGTVGKLVAAVLREGAGADDGGYRQGVSVARVRYLVVDVPHYKGPAFWPDHPTWIPVPPVEVRHAKNQAWSRTQLPVVLAFGMTVHKSQGLTFRGHTLLDFRHQPTYQPVAKLGLAFVGMSRCTDFARQAFRNLPAFSEFRKILVDPAGMYKWRKTFEERMDRIHDRCMHHAKGQAWGLDEDVAAHVQWTEQVKKRDLKAEEIADIRCMLQVRGLLEPPPFQGVAPQAPGLQGGGGKRKAMGMPAPGPTKKARTTPAGAKRPYEPGVEESHTPEGRGGIGGEPPRWRGRVGSTFQAEMAGNAAPVGWFCQLLNRFVGRAVQAPAWYMPVASNAVHAGRQRAATCGLHAVNHSVHLLGHVFTWAEFDGRVAAGERRASGDWLDTALQRNLQAVGATMHPVMGEDHETYAAWDPDQSRLAVWRPDVLGCVVHVPGHWVALVRPEGAPSAQNAALLCDSLHRQPYALTAEEVGEFFAQVALWQQGAAEQQAGEWSVQVITHDEAVMAA